MQVEIVEPKNYNTMYRDAASDVLKTIRSYESGSGYEWQSVLSMAERRAPSLFASYWRLQNLADSGFDENKASSHSWLVEEYTENLARWKDSVRRLLEFHQSALSGVKVTEKNWLMF